VRLRGRQQRLISTVYGIRDGRFRVKPGVHPYVDKRLQCTPVSRRLQVYDVATVTAGHVEPSEYDKGDRK